MKTENNLTRNEIIKRTVPFCLALAVIILDQLTKWIVVKYIPAYTLVPELCFGGDLIRIIHVRNLGVAFSMGGTWPLVVRKVIFSVIPLIVIAYIIYFSIRNNEFTKLQRWCIAAIVGGGIGNLIDRIFRPNGVVDFVDVKFFGIFGLERWPTFNFADAMIVVFGIILIITFIMMISDSEKKGKK
ncbi:MAG: signal peptidase II [Treponema sp.]|nr:signal peptidase II [Candidatus Treponema merdequi]